MTKRNKEDEAEGDDTSSSSSTVFIDTSLDTQFAMIVSHSDTVFNLKQKIMYEHPKCFPNYGDIIINALKVKRKGSFYHLSDSMLVKSAFEGAKKCWFLSVDASSLKQPNENRMPNKPEAENELALIPCQDTNQSYRQQADSSSNQIMYICYPGNRFSEVQKELEIEVKKVAFDSCSQVFSDCIGRVDYTREKLEQVRERQVGLETHVKQKEGDSRVGLIDDLIYDPQESSVRSESGVNKRCKSKKKGKTAASNYTVKEADIGIDEHSSGKTVTEVPKDMEVENINGCNMVSEVNTDRKDDNTEGLIGKKFNKPLEESRRSGTISNKNHKSKKMTDVAISNFTVKNDNVDIRAYSSGKTDKEVPVNVEMVNTDTAKGNMEVSTVDDNDLRLSTGEFLGTHVKAREDVAESQVSDAQGNIKLQTASKERKRRGRGKKDYNLPGETKNEIAMINSVVPESSVMIDAAKENTEVNTLDDNGPRLNTGEFLDTSVGIRDEVAENLVSDAQGSTELEKASKKRKRSRDKRDGNLREETNSEIAMINSVVRKSSVMIEAAEGNVEVNILDDNGLRLNTGEFLETCVGVRDDVAENLVSDAHGNMELEKASKKRKREKSEKDGNPQEETKNETVVINAIVPESSLILKHKNMPASCDTLITEVSEDENLGSAVASSGEKQRKKKRREVIIEPHFPHNPKEEMSKEDAETVATKTDNEIVKSVGSDIHKASDVAIVSEPSVQLAIPSAVGGNVVEHDDANVKAKLAAPDIGPESGYKGSKKTKKRRSSKVVEVLPPTVAESGNLRDDIVLSSDQDVARDDQDVKIDGPDKIKGQRDMSHYHDNTGERVPEKSQQPYHGGGHAQSKAAMSSGKLVENNINMEPGKSFSSKKLKKRAEKPVSTEAGLSSACADTGGTLSGNKDELLPLTHVNKSQEDEEVFLDNFVKGVEKNLWVKVKQNKVDSLQHNISVMTPAGIEDAAAKSKKILKKNQKSGGETLSSLPIKEQEGGAKELVSSDERHIETDNASKIEIRRKMDKMISENQSCMNNLEPNKNIGNGLGLLPAASDSTQAPSSCSSDAHETSFGNVLSNQNLGDANGQQSNTKRKVDRNDFLGYFSQIKSDREAPKVKPTVKSIKMLKSSDVAVKAKKKTEGKLSLDNNRSTVVKSSSKGKVDIFKKNLGASSENRAKKAPSTILSSSSDEEEEEEDEAVQDSARNGEAKNGRSHKETGTPRIGVILRNTITFKKVRLAAQSRIEDMESKEVDVVPESEPF